jgi:O-antigen/teichoic acid export membrane protein
MLKTFVRHMVAYLPSKLLPALTGFITAPILTRLLLPAEYGNWALAAGVYEFLFALSCSGLASVPVRFFPAYRAKSELGVFFVTLSISLVMLIAITSTVGFLAIFTLERYLTPALFPLLIISVLIFMVQAMYTVFLAVVQAQQRSRVYSFFELLTRYGGLGLGLLLVIVFGFRVEGLLWGECLMLALVFPFLLFLTMKGVSLRPRHFRPSVAFEMWHYAWPLALGNMAMWGLRLSDRYIISFFRSESEVGLYSVAYSISGKSIDMLVALLSAWENQGREATEKTLAMMTRFFLTLCLPAAAGLSLMARPFVALLTDEAYHEGYRIVGYVAFSSFAWGLFMIANMGSLIKKDTRRIAINQGVAASVNLGLNLVLVPRFGFVAAGITTLVGYAVLLALQAHASRPHLTWLFPFKTLRNVVIATTGMGLAVFAVNAMPGNWDGPHLGYLFLSIVVGVLVYFILLLLLGEASEGERTAAKRFWHQVAGKAG